MNQKASYIDYNGKRIYAKVRGKSRAEGVTRRNDPKKLDKRYALRGKTTTLFEYIVTYEHRYKTPYDGGLDELYKIVKIEKGNMSSTLSNLCEIGYITKTKVTDNRKVRYQYSATDIGIKWYLAYAKDKWRIPREEMQDMVNPKLKVADF